MDCSKCFTRHPVVDLYTNMTSGKHSAMPQLLHKDYSFIHFRCCNFVAIAIRVMYHETKQPHQCKVFFQNSDRSGARQSAAARLFPSGIPASYTSSSPTVNSEERVRRISDLFTPRPFTVGARSTSVVRSVSVQRPESENEAASTEQQDWRNAAVTTMHINPATWQPSQPVSCTITTATVKPMTASSVPSENLPNVKRGSASGLTPREKMRMRRTPGSRFQTISSSEPVKLEQTPTKPAKIHTTAGDLISSVSHYCAA